MACANAYSRGAPHTIINAFISGDVWPVHFLSRIHLRPPSLSFHFYTNLILFSHELILFSFGLFGGKLRVTFSRSTFDLLSNICNINEMEYTSILIIYLKRDSNCMVLQCFHPCAQQLRYTMIEFINFETLNRWLEISRERYPRNDKSLL